MGSKIFELITTFHSDLDDVKQTGFLLISSYNVDRLLKGQDLAGVLPPSLVKLPYLKTMYCIIDLELYFQTLYQIIIMIILCLRNILFNICPAETSRSTI